MRNRDKFYNVKSWADPRVVVRDSTIEGRGGFPRELIRKGEIVVVLGGTLMTQREFEDFAARASHYDAVQIDEALHLVDLLPDARAANGSLNHSCDSNLWMQDEITIVARRDIQPGEELTVDYALFTATPDWILDVPCQCHSSVCRRTVTGNDWLNLSVQQRYDGHFSPFINARIQKLAAS